MNPMNSFLGFSHSVSFMSIPGSHFFIRACATISIIRSTIQLIVIVWKRSAASTSKFSWINALLLLVIFSVWRLSLGFYVLSTRKICRWFPMRAYRSCLRLEICRSLKCCKRWNGTISLDGFVLNSVCKCHIACFRSAWCLFHVKRMWLPCTKMRNMWLCSALHGTSTWGSWRRRGEEMVNLVLSEPSEIIDWWWWRISTVSSWVTHNYSKYWSKYSRKKGSSASNFSSLFEFDLCPPIFTIFLVMTQRCWRS